MAGKSCVWQGTVAVPHAVLMSLPPPAFAADASPHSLQERATGVPERYLHYCVLGLLVSKRGSAPTVRRTDRCWSFASSAQWHVPAPQGEADLLPALATGPAPPHICQIKRQ